jgi:AmiR/NasT family two-component response regulator
MPLQVGARTVGALNVYCTRAHTWDDDDLMAARVLANVATTFIIQGTKLEQSNRLNDQLQEALDSRVVIEQAKGILSGENAIDLDTSFELLRSHARNNQAALRSVAEDVVNNGLRPPMPR